MAVRKVIWYLILIPLIAIYLLPLFDPVEERHRIIVSEFAQRGNYFNYKGYAIWYLREESSASKATFVLLHGFPTQSYDFVSLIPELRKRGSVVAFDFLGFGLSDKPSFHNYTLMEQSDITVALLKYLKVDRVHVLAHDYGVSVGQELLARDLEGKLPFQLDSVAFLNGGLVAGLHRPLITQILLQSHHVGPLLTRAMNYYAFRRSFSAVFGSQTQPSEEDLRVLWAFLLRKNGHHRAHDLLQYMPERHLHKDRWVGALKMTKVPLKMIIGPADPISGRHHADGAVALVGNKLNLSYLGDQIGHYPQLEAGPEVLRLYNEFLTFL